MLAFITPWHQTQKKIITFITKCHLHLKIIPNQKGDSFSFLIPNFTL